MRQSSEHAITDTQRREIFGVGRTFGETLKGFGHSDYEDQIASRLARIYQAASTPVNEALAQGMWHGYEHSLPLSIVLQRDSEVQS